MVDRRQDIDTTVVARSRRRSAPIAEPGDKRELDMASLDASIGYHMRRAQIAIFHDIIKAFSADDIRPAQFSVMVLIAANPGLNQSELAAALGIKRTNFVALIDSLETRGLARRAATLADRRSYALFLTEAGTELLARLTELQREHEARVLARIGPRKRNQLLTMLTQISALAGDDLVEE